MNNVIIGGKYDDGTKIIFKILFKKSFSSTMLTIKNILSWDDC
jgi:hypothetical protein